MTLGEVLRVAENFVYIRIKVKKCGLMFETRYAAERLKGHQNEEFEKLKEREVIRFCNNRVGIGDTTNELEIEIKEGKMTIYKIGNITVHIHGNVNQKNLEEATAKFLKAVKRKQKDEKKRVV